MCTFLLFLAAGKTFFLMSWVLRKGRYMTSFLQYSRFSDKFSSSGIFPLFMLFYVSFATFFSYQVSHVFLKINLPYELPYRVKKNCRFQYIFRLPWQTGKTASSLENPPFQRIQVKESIPIGKYSRVHVRFLKRKNNVKILTQVEQGFLTGKKYGLNSYHS